MNKAKIDNVAGYIRISTDEEHQPYSLSAQEDRIREYVRSRGKEGYRISKIYRDQRSAASLDRPSLQNLLEDAEKSYFDVVLVVKMDRLCRNLADQLWLTEHFQKWGIRLEATDEPIDLETPDGITWTQIRGAFNEAERRKISYRTKMGMRKKASLGGWCGGYTPLGYRYDKSTKTLIPDLDEKQIVERVFYLYAEKKMGAKSIAVSLNKHGFRTRNGHPFSTSLVLSVVTNPFYTGKIKWGREIFPGNHTPLIDERIFNQAQQILSQRPGNPSLRRSNSSNYPLSGLLRCQKCGRYLVGVSAHGRSRVYQYYACPGKFKYGECQLENLPRETIDTNILSQVRKLFEDSQLISRILQRVNIKRAEKLPKKQAELRSIERQISQKRGIMQKYLSAFESGALQARSLNERVKEIEDEIALLKERKRYLEDEINRSKIQPVTVESVRKVIGKLEEVISSASPSEKRAFIRNIIKTIKVHSRSYIEPYYRIPSVRIMSGLAPRTGRC